MTSANLWGKLEPVAYVPPVAILVEQATKLGELTKNILRGEVRQLSAATAALSYTLEVVAPLVKGYRHRVLAIQYGLLTPYPLVIMSMGNRRAVECATEEEFIQNLASILQSEDIQKPIRMLLTLSLQAVQPEDARPEADTSE